MNGWPDNLRQAVEDHLGNLPWGCSPGEYDYDDNYRYARVGNKKEEAAYEVAASKGCCGFYDKTITVDDVEIMVGFNYGH